MELSIALREENTFLLYEDGEERENKISAKHTPSFIQIAWRDKNNKFIFTETDWS